VLVEFNRYAIEQLSEENPNEVTNSFSRPLTQNVGRNRLKIESQTLRLDNDTLPLIFVFNANIDS